MTHPYRTLATPTGKPPVPLRCRLHLHAWGVPEVDEYSTLVGVQAITAMVETIRYVCSGCGATLIRHYRQCPKPDVTVALKRFYHEHPDLV